MFSETHWFQKWALLTSKGDKGNGGLVVSLVPLLLHTMKNLSHGSLKTPCAMSAHRKKYFFLIKKI